MHRKILHCPLIIFFILFSCSGTPADEAALAHIGFYSSPEEIIKKFKKENRDYRKNFIVAVALKKQRRYKRSLKYFANSCFKDYQDFKIEILNRKIVDFTGKNRKPSEYFNDAVYEIADIYYKYKKYNYSLELLNKISASHKSLYHKVILLKANVYAAMGEYEKALLTLKNSLKFFPEEDLRSLIFIRMGSVL